MVCLFVLSACRELDNLKRKVAVEFRLGGVSGVPARIASKERALVNESEPIASEGRASQTSILQDNLHLSPTPHIKAGISYQDSIVYTSPPTSAAIGHVGSLYSKVIRQINVPLGVL